MDYLGRSNLARNFTSVSSHHGLKVLNNCIKFGKPAILSQQN